MSLAVIATVIWSGNFIIARGVFREIPPITLNFCRWFSASIIILPFAINKVRLEKQYLFKHWKYLFWVALTGIALFNTFVYVAGHYTSAINMALLGTTSSPVIATFLGAIFLKEAIRPLRMLGLGICITGILLLVTGGNVSGLIGFRFSIGDMWILLGALFFAIYNTLVRQKPVTISSLPFLFVCFALGTVLLFPFAMLEVHRSAPIVWNIKLFGIILYLGLGASVICYLCWNLAIGRLGSSRTAMFSNLIPVFSSIEALLILDEDIKMIHILSGVLVISGLVIANLKR